MPRASPAPVPASKLITLHHLGSTLSRAFPPHAPCVFGVFLSTARRLSVCVYRSGRQETQAIHSSHCSTHTFHHLPWSTVSKKRHANLSSHCFRHCTPLHLFFIVCLPLTTTVSPAPNPNRLAFANCYKDFTCSFCAVLLSLPSLSPTPLPGTESVSFV